MQGRHAVGMSSDTVMARTHRGARPPGKRPVPPCREGKWPRGMSLHQTCAAFALVIPLLYLSFDLHLRAKHVVSNHVRKQNSLQLVQCGSSLYIFDCHNN